MGFLDLVDSNMQWLSVQTAPVERYSPPFVFAEYPVKYGRYGPRSGYVGGLYNKESGCFATLWLPTCKEHTLFAVDSCPVTRIYPEWLVPSARAAYEQGDGEWFATLCIAAGIEPNYAVALRSAVIRHLRLYDLRIEELNADKRNALSQQFSWQAVRELTLLIAEGSQCQPQIDYVNENTHLVSAMVAEQVAFIPTVATQALVPAQQAFTNTSVDDISYSALGYRIEQYERIGNGSGLTAVYRGHWRGMVVALKQFNDRFLTHQQQKKFLREAYFMQEIQSEYVVAFYDFILHPRPCLIMEYVSGGTLWQLLRENGKVLSWDKRLLFSNDLLHAIEVMHDHNVVHGDVKSLNMLVGATGRLKIGDFDCAVHACSTANLPIAADNKWTLRWVAPEVARGETGVTKASDIYSLGMVLWEIMTGNVPFFTLQSDEEVEQEIIANRTEFLHSDVMPMSPEPAPKLARLIKACWLAHQQRPSIKGAIAHMEGVPLDDKNYTSEGLSTVRLVT